MSILELNINNGLAEFIAPINIPLIVGTISAIDGTVIGKLSSEDVNNPTRSGSFSDDYSLVDVTAIESVSISLTSGIFDTYLQLINADTQEVIDFDDDSGEELNSLLTFVPEAGINYIVRVTSFSGGVTGEYTLSATNLSGVDLVVSEIIAPNTAALGSTIDISWTVTNQGTQATTTTWDDYIYFSTNEFFDFSDTFITSESVFNPLAAGESYTIDRSVNISTFLAAGEGYLLVVTDRFNAQLETDEDNNVTAIPFTLTVPDVDLVVSEIIAPDTAALGSTIDISWTVINQGTEATTASFGWRDDIYFSTDEFFDLSDTFLDVEFIVNPLAAGESYTRDQSVSLSSFFGLPLEAGEGYLLVVTDIFNEQPETDEENNVTAIPFNITNFDPAQYGASHPDLISEFGYNLEAFRQHYFDFGRFEGRSLDNFDEFRYIASHPADLISAFGTNGAAATEHYIRFGFSEERSLTHFDPAQYLASHGDLIDFSGYNLSEATLHYIQFGFDELRPIDTFAETSYIASYDDLTRFYGYNPAGGTEHYIRFGYNEILAGTRPQPNFDPALYLATHDDLIQSVNQQFANPSTGSLSDNYDLVLEFGNFHCIRYGINEGRSRFGFDPNSYLSLHSDLQAAFGNDLLAATRHYIEFGFEEERMWM